ncbi:MAG: VOC family protein [Myxococcota bacterium]
MRCLFPDICSDDLVACRDFYTAMFDFEIVFEIDWYVQLKCPANDALQIAFVTREHSSVPSKYREHPRGVVITLETDAVDPLFDRAKRLGLNIILPVQDEVWGQRHFMIEDPNGLVVDVVQMIPPTDEFLREHGLA